MLVEWLYRKSSSSGADDIDTSTSTLSELRYPFESFWEHDTETLPDVSCV